MKIKPLSYEPLRFIPKADDFEHFERLCCFLTDKPQDLAKRYGHYASQFNYDLGLVDRNTYTISGKPAINAAGLVSLARMSGLCSYIVERERNDERVTIELKRNDEPADIVHTYTITMQDALRAGWTRNPMWKKDPQAMLSSRVTARAVRGVFPEVSSGMYTIDELADSMPISTQEMNDAMSAAFGDDATHTKPPRPQHYVEHVPQPQPQAQPQPQPQPQPQAQPQPQPQAQPQPQPQPQAQPQPQPQPQAQALPTPPNRFETRDDFVRACAFNDIPVAEAMRCAQRLGIQLKDLGAKHLRDFFYTWCLSSTLRNSALKVGWWRNMSESKSTVEQLHAEYPALVNLDARKIGKSLGDAMFWEAVKICKDYQGSELESAVQIITQWANDSSNINHGQAVEHLKSVAALSVPEPVPF